MGNGLAKKPPFPGLDSRSIAHNERLKRGPPGPLVRDHRALLGNRMTTRAGFIFPAKE
jgi:hypothetical protein